MEQFYRKKRCQATVVDVATAATIFVWYAWYLHFTGIHQILFLMTGLIYIIDALYTSLIEAILQKFDGNTNVIIGNIVLAVSALLLYIICHIRVFADWDSFERVVEY